MRAIVQKVKKASVKVSDKLISEIGEGLLVFVAVTDSDTKKDIDYIKKKIGTDIPFSWHLLLLCG